MKRNIHIVLLLIFLLTILSGCSLTKVDVSDFSINFMDNTIISASDIINTEDLTHTIDIPQGDTYTVKYTLPKQLEQIDYDIKQDNENVEVKKYSNGITIEGKTIGNTKLTFSFDGNFDKKKVTLNVNIKPSILYITSTQSVDLTGNPKPNSNNTVEIEANGIYTEITLNADNGEEVVNGVKYKVTPIKEINTEIKDNKLYVSTVKAGTFTLDIEATANEYKPAKYQLTINAKTPLIQCKITEPNFNEIYLNDENIKINILPENLNTDRIVYYRKEKKIKADPTKLLRYDVKYDEEMLTVRNDMSGNISFTPKKQGNTTLTITLIADGYENYTYTSNFKILPPRAKFIPSTDLIDIDVKNGLRVQYSKTDKTDLEFIYDKANINIQVGSTGIFVRGLKESSGDIKVRAFGEGLIETITTIPYKVTKEKIRPTISAEMIGDVITKNKYLQFGNIPKHSNIEYKMSEEGKLEVSISDGRLILKPIADGTVDLEIEITADGYESFYLKKQIKIQCPKIILESKITDLYFSEGEKETIAIKKQPTTSVTITAKPVDENVCTVEVSSSGTLQVTAKQMGNTEIIVEGKREGYTPYILKIPVTVGEKKTTLKIATSVEAYPDFINSIPYEIPEKDGNLTYVASSNIEVVSFNGGNKGRLVFKAIGEGTITFTATSSEAIDNIVICNVQYLNQSTNANGINILHLFDEVEGYTVYNHNKTMFNMFNLPPTSADINPNTYGEELEALTALAKSITNNKGSNRNKALAIYNWVIRNIYYDYDGLNGKSDLYTTAYDVYKNKRGICDGYASLYAELCRIAGVPARKVEGQYRYQDKNWANSTVNTHAWNEVWIDNKWVIVDSTWGTYYRYENGKFDKSKGIDTTYRYFSPTLENFSKDHRIDTIETFYN